MTTTSRSSEIPSALTDYVIAVDALCDVVEAGNLTMFDRATEVRRLRPAAYQAMLEIAHALDHSSPVRRDHAG